MALDEKKPMSTLEALELALYEELRAIELYTKFRDEHKGARETFSFLIKEEEKHRDLLQRLINELIGQ